MRPTSLEDSAFILELFNTPQWIKYIGDRNVKTEHQAREYISEKITSQFKRLGFSSFTIIRKEDGAKLGTCGLYDREGLEDIDIGFALLPKFGKMGYALEASFKMKDAAFSIFGLESLSAITRSDNFPSQRLLEKLGMKLMGPITLPHDNEDLLLYSIRK